VLVHGGPTGNWRDAVDAWGQLLVARGYAVLYPNVRGSVGYGEKFLEMNRADWGGGDFKDVMSASRTWSPRELRIQRDSASADGLTVATWRSGP